MDMRKCPDCGELYSVSYKKCPFCEEERLESLGKQPARRKGGRRVAAKEPSVVGPVVIIVALLLAALLLYFFFGDSLAKTLGFGDEAGISDTDGGDEVPGSDANTPNEPQDPSTDPGDGDSGIVMPQPSGDDGSGDSGDGDIDEPQGGTLTLSHTDFTLKPSEVYSLTVTGGTAPYTWSISDEAVAKVDANGAVTAMGGGNTTLKVTDSAGRMAECIVRVKGAAAGSLSLSHTDITLKVGESVRLTLTGADSANWTIDKASVASVTSDGKVTGVAKGNATLTVTSGSMTATCIVRVK